LFEFIFVLVVLWHSCCPAFPSLNLALHYAGASLKRKACGVAGFAVDKKRADAARKKLAMYFFTSNKPPERAGNLHLRSALAILGLETAPTARDLRGAALDQAVSEVRLEALQALKTCSYAFFTDGWSKRAAKRGVPLVNVMVCPADGAAVFWCVKDASGHIKNKDWVVQLHRVSLPPFHSIFIPT
jgi:hypothetical protein